MTNLRASARILASKKLAAASNFRAMDTHLAATSNLVDTIKGFLESMSSLQEALADLNDLDIISFSSDPSRAGYTTAGSLKFSTTSSQLETLSTLTGKFIKSREDKNESVKIDNFDLVGVAKIETKDAKTTVTMTFKV